MLKITKNQGSIQVTADKSGFYPFDGTITFPTNSLFTATSANTDMITFKSTSNGDVQFVGNYKDITISGRSYDTKQKFLTAFSNLANQGSVDAYTKAETDTKLDAKQDKLTAGTGIKITKDETTGKTFVNTKLEMGKGPYNSDGIRIGRIARLESSDGIAFGDESISKNRGIAIGYKAQSWGISSIVIGENSSDQDGAAIGTSVGSGVVIGDGARGAGAGVVIGKGTHGGGVGAVIGYNSTVDGNGYGYAIGDNVHISETTNMVPIAIGYGAVANETKPLAVTILKVSDTDSDGNPEMKYCDFIQGDSNGKISLLKGDGTDTRMVIQDEIEALKNAGGGGSANPMVNVKGTNGNATIPDNITDAVAIGSGAKVEDEKTIAIGSGTRVYDSGVAIGSGTFAANSCVAIGRNAGGSSWGVAIGQNARTINYNSVAVGYNALARGEYSVAIGSETGATTDMPLVIKAGYKTVNNVKKPLTVLQSDSTGKLSILKGDGTDERMVIQDEIEALKNAGGGGSVDAYTKAETDTKLEAKQDKLTAGSGITITKDETAGTSTIATAVSLTDNGNGHYTIGDSIKMGYGIAIGKNTVSNSSDSIAVGRAASTTGSSAIAIGTSSSVGGENSIAIGYNTINDGIYCVLIGDSSRMGELDDQGSVIIGSNANGTSGTTSTLIGFSASSSGFACTGIGPTARVDDTTPLVIKAGHKTVSDGEQILTMIQGDANGKISLLKGDGTDTRMVIQDEIEALKNAGGSGGSANPLVAVKGEYGATIPDNVTDAVAIGTSAVSRTKWSIAVGNGATSGSGGSNVAIGNVANSSGGSSIAIGKNTETSNSNTIAIGTLAGAYIPKSIAIGYNAKTSTNIPMVINAGGKTMIQGGSDGKISIPLGDGTASTMCIQDEIAALKAEIAALKGGASTGA